MKRILLASAVIALVACGKSGGKRSAAPIDPTPINAAVSALADRACGCNNEMGCVKLARRDWDAGKLAWLDARKSFPVAAATVFDANFGRMAACGDAAGLTFWREL